MRPGGYAIRRLTVVPGCWLPGSRSGFSIRGSRCVRTGRDAAGVATGCRLQRIENGPPSPGFNLRAYATAHESAGTGNPGRLGNIAYRGSLSQLGRHGNIWERVRVRVRSVDSETDAGPHPDPLPRAEIPLDVGEGALSPENRTDHRRAWASVDGLAKPAFAGWALRGENDEYSSF